MLSLVCGIVSAGGLAAQAKAPLTERFQALAKAVQSATVGPVGPLTDKEEDLLEAAGIGTSHFTDVDIVALVRVLQFGAGLGKDEWGPATDYATSAAGRAMARPLMTLQVLRGDVEAAARLAIAAAVDQPRARRSYALWKYWELGFGQRDDAPELSRAFELALIGHGESEDETTRQVVADLFSRERLTKDDIAKIRRAIEEMLKVRLAERAEFMRVAKEQGEVWIEDRKGLKRGLLMPTMDVDRWEIRLGKSGDDPAARSVWGTLVGIYADNLQAEADVLRELALAAGADLVKFDVGRGPVAKLARPVRGDDPFAAPVRELDGAMTAALAAGGFARVLTQHGFADPAGEAAAGEALVKRAFDTVRRAAARLRVLTGPDRTEDALDEDGDEQLIVQLGQVTRDTAAWGRRLNAVVPATAGKGAWHDMRRVGPRGRRERVFVKLGRDRGTILGIDQRNGASDVPGIYQGLMRTEVAREDLRGAQYSIEREGSLRLVVELASPVGVLWLSLPPADGTDFQLRLIGDSAVRGSRKGLIISCDTEAHAQELSEALQRFAAGAGK